MSNFVKDVLSREMSLKQVCKKYNVAMDDVLERYHMERAKYTEDEIQQIMNEVYYGFEN